VLRALDVVDPQPVERERREADLVVEVIRVRVDRAAFAAAAYCMLQPVTGTGSVPRL
jgi:hypothetical protein